MMTVTFIGLASSVVWLRWRVAGWRGMALVVPLAVMLALNWMWLMGFYNFLLGACLFPVTLGFWWAERERMGLGRALILAGLLVFGYFCHLISLALTVVGLIVLAITTPGSGWRRRCLWTSASLIPLAPLGIMYHGLMQAGGEARPSWVFFSNLWPPRNWIKPLLLANSLHLNNVNTFPFIEWTSPWFRLLNPTLWVAVALVLLVAATIFAQRKEGRFPDRTCRAWITLTLLLFVGFYMGPSDFGSQHGTDLRARVLLLGLVSIIPILEINFKRLSVRLGAAALIMALVIQIALVWDYALTSNRVASEFMQAKSHVGTHLRIKSLLIADHKDPELRGLRGRFKARPLLNLDNMLGIGTGNIIWNNYEAVQYYFPVKYRDDATHDHALRISEAMRVALPDLNDATKHLDEWAGALPTIHDKIDVLVLWGTDPRIDKINTQWFGPQPIFEQGNVRVYRHR